jgi:hypothetical protein
MGDILEQLIAQILEGHAAAVAQVVAEFRDTHVSPPLTSPSSRAVTFTPPNKSPSLTITSPTLMPMRKCIDGASGWTSSAFASFLDLDGTVYGVERAGKFGEHTIAGGVPIRPRPWNAAGVPRHMFEGLRKGRQAGMKQARQHSDTWRLRG